MSLRVRVLEVYTSYMSIRSIFFLFDVYLTITKLEYSPPLPPHPMACVLNSQILEGLHTASVELLKTWEEGIRDRVGHEEPTRELLFLFVLEEGWCVGNDTKLVGRVRVETFFFLFSFFFCDPPLFCRSECAQKRIIPEPRLGT